MTDTLNKLKADDFQEHINSDFVIKLTDEAGTESPYSLTLDAVERVGEKERDMAAHGRESFSLIFKNPETERYLMQSTFALHHDSLGVLHLFIVPLGPREDGMYYEVIFT